MIYSVDIIIAHPRAAEWEEWMRSRHVPDVLATGCFRRAWMLRSAEADTATHRGYRMLYELEDEGALERYRSQHAAFLQQEHLERYAGDYEASRTVHDVIETFSPGAGTAAGTTR